MTLSRFRAAALMLAVSLGACESAQTTAPEFSTSDDGLATILASVNSADPRGAGSGNSLFDRLANEIPGFGGLYRNAVCSVAVVLTDLSQSDHAIRVVKAALEPNRACPNGIRVHAVQGKFTYVELQRYLAASRELLQLRGVLGAHVDLQQNRLVNTIVSREVAATVLEALPRV
ncbi:MAG: hypothetical protein ACREMA_18420, partial [Longimicrobiales bacterium]